MILIVMLSVLHLLLCVWGGCTVFLLVLEYQGSHNKHPLFKVCSVCVCLCVIEYECIVVMVLSVVYGMGSILYVIYYS